MARWLRPCNLLLLLFMLVATAVANECNPCTYASPPPPVPPPSPPPPVPLPPPVSCPPPPPVVIPTPPVVNPPTPYVAPPPVYNPTPSGWYTPPYMPSYLTPPGTLYPQDLGFRPNASPSCGVAWRAAIFTAAAVAGVLAM